MADTLSNNGLPPKPTQAKPMPKCKQQALVEAGWKAGDAADFLGMSDEEKKQLDLGVEVAKATNSAALQRTIEGNVLERANYNNIGTIHHAGETYQVGPALVFEITGKQETAGSKTMLPVTLKDGRKINMITEGKDKDARARSVNWRSLVQTRASEAVTLANFPLASIWESPLYMLVEYTVPRPKGHYKADGQLSKDGNSKPWPLSKPDVLKLTRAIEDALKDVLYRDDAAVVIEHISKHYRDRHHTRVTIRPLLSNRLAW